MIETRERERRREAFRTEIEKKRRRLLRAKQNKEKGLWFGLGMFGLIGWSIAIPALIGTAAGIWLDTHTSSRYSWTLMLLVLGVFIGALNAWFWVSKEQRAISRELEDAEEEDSDGFRGGGDGR